MRSSIQCPGDARGASGARQNHVHRRAERPAARLVCSASTIRHAVRAQNGLIGDLDEGIVVAGRANGEPRFMDARQGSL